MHIIFCFVSFFAFPKPWIAGRLCKTDSFFSPKTFTRGYHVAVGNGLSKTVTRDYVKALKHVNYHPPIKKSVQLCILSYSGSLLLMPVVPPLSFAF